jgi:ribosomal protein S21
MTNIVVRVNDGDVKKALKKLQRLCGNEGITAAIRRKEFYKKPSEQRRLKHRRALARASKVASRLARDEVPKT